MRINLNVSTENHTAKPDLTERRLLRAAAREALRDFGLTRDAEISLVFTDDSGIQALNKEYREKDASTDVLSFPLWDDPRTAELPPGSALPLGDIVISRPHAAAQAEAYGHSELRETVFLFVHGLLHLLGYDHERSAEEEAAMFACQDRVLDALGLSR